MDTVKQGFCAYRGFPMFKERVEGWGVMWRVLYIPPPTHFKTKKAARVAIDVYIEVSTREFLSTPTRIVCSNTAFL